MAGKDNSSETLAKGLWILDIFGDDDVGYTLAQISRRTGINKTSIYRYVNTFCDLGFLKRDDRTGLYRLGVRMLALAKGKKVYDRREDLKQKAVNRDTEREMNRA